MEKTILITGGGGFIGRALTTPLLNAGCRLVVVDKDIDHVEKSLPQTQVIVGDVCEPKLWAELPRCDYVFHLAAPSSVVLFDDDLDGCVNTTLSGLMNAFAWSKKNKVKKLIYPSSGSIFGRNNNNCSEVSIPDPVNSYGKTKLSCEYLAKIYSDSVPNLGLRIFAGYGPEENNKGQIASVVTLFLNRMMRNQSPIIYGDGEQARDFVYIDDIVESMIKMLDSRLTGILNVGSGKSTTFNEVVSVINKLLNTQIKPKFIKKPNGYLDRTACDCSLFKNVLGRNPMSLLQGIEKYFATARITT